MCCASIWSTRARIGGASAWKLCVEPVARPPVRHRWRAEGPLFVHFFFRGEACMPVQVVQKRCRGPLCVSAQPEGCRRLVEQHIAQERARGTARTTLRSVLIVGCSAGYGLAARLVAAWRYRARTVGVMLERPPEGRRTATAGYYNTVALHEFAHRDGLEVLTYNLDAFSDAARAAAIEALAGAPAQVFIYSLAAPRRLHPRTGHVHQSVLKPIGAPFTERTVELDTGRIVPVTLEPATADEIADTVAVMGGEDWKFWVEALLEAGVLAPGAQTIALSYIGPRLTWPIYRDGTIGRAKAHLEQTARELNRIMAERMAAVRAFQCTAQWSRRPRRPSRSYRCTSACCCG